jgi:hypothetical protein
MKTEELQAQNQLADQLIGKLDRIKALWSEIPSEDDLSGMVDATSHIAAKLEYAMETWQSDDFPNEGDLNDVSHVAAGLASSLNEAKETFNSADFPNEDDLNSLPSN